MSEQIPEAPRLNPAQQQVLDELGSTDRPTFRDDLRDHLRHEIEEAIAPLLDAHHHITVDQPLFLSKRKLSLVHGCEARYLADLTDEFSWSIPAARGTVAHKAIEILITRRGNPTPLDLVNDAMDRLELDERSLGEFIRGLDEAERAELVGSVNDFVSTFVESFPPIKRQWVPVAESRSRANLCNDRVVLQGVTDLSLGRSRGNEAGKVLIDLKTGRPQAGHIDDLRFYAFLETLKFGVPPRLLVNYLLESGEPRKEPVTEDMLWTTGKRVVDAVEKLLALETGEREARRTPSGVCRFCPIQSDCAEGTQHLAVLDDAVAPASPIS